MSLYGVELNHQIDRLVTEIRLQLHKHKLLPNVRTIYRSFAKYDPEISGIIRTDHFEKALGQNGLFFKKHQYQIFQKAFGHHQGQIGWFQFLQAIKVPFNQKRRELVDSIFSYINQQSEHLNADSISRLFNPVGIQIYDNKKVTKNHLENQLISLLPMPLGYLTREQFIAFYEDISVNYPNDDVFKKYVSKQWNYVPSQEDKITEQALREIIKALRFKLIQKSKGTNDQFLMKKLFDEYDENKNGFISPFQLDLMLKKLELPIKAEAVQPLFRKLDKNTSGFIEYDEFKRFLFFDPFPA